MSGASPEAIGAELVARGLTLAVAESCTGGLLGAALTSVSGSSAYFRGGVIAYANEVKVRCLDVDAGDIDRHGAVSAEVARQMARGARVRVGADIGIGITGVAGPGGGSEEKPVGTVFVAVCVSDRCAAERFRFAGGREDVRSAACKAALAMLAGELGCL